MLQPVSVPMDVTPEHTDWWYYHQLDIICKRDDSAPSPLITFSVLKVRIVKLLITPEQQRKMFKVGDISLGKNLWIRRFCSSPDIS